MPKYDVVKIYPETAPDDDTAGASAPTEVKTPGRSRLTYYLIGGGLVVLIILCLAGWFVVGRITANDYTPTPTKTTKPMPPQPG